MKKALILTALMIVNAAFAFSQSWKTSIERINSLTKTYDPYVRIFSYTEYNNKLTWITQEGDITVAAVLSKVKYYAEPSGSNYYVTFECKDASKCIECTYGGDTKASSITVTSKYAADQIVDEIKKIENYFNNKGYSSSYSSSSYQSNIDRINELCVQYDPYIRKFSYNDYSKILTWINKDGDITVSADIRNISAEAKQGSYDCSVTFSCDDGTKCIACNYTGPVSASAITLKELSPANQIVSEFNKIKSGQSGSYTSGTSFNWQSNIDRINELCVKYDPYIRKFSYNPGTNKLKWINKDGDIISEAELTKVKVAVSPSSYGSDYYVQFRCKTEGTKCIDCTYGGASDLNAITLTNKSAADEVVTLVQQIMDKGASSTSSYTYSSSGWQASITKINGLTKLYDPYVRIFSYNESSKELKFVTQDGDITITANINDIYIYKEPSGSNYYITFECKDGSQCLQSTYSGKTKLTSITITSSDAADQIITEFQKNAPGTKKSSGTERSPWDRMKDAEK